jgi:uncharacterized protein (TIRG00374 family)
MRLANVAAGFAITAVLLWLFFKDTAWDAVGAGIAAARFELLALAAVGTCLSILLRAWRWLLLLEHLRPNLAYMPVLSAYVAGFATSTLLPGRMGEVVRPALMSRDAGIPFMSGLATLVTERLLDLVMVLALVASGFIFPEVLVSAGAGEAAAVIDAVRWVSLVSFAIAGGVILFLVLLLVDPARARRLADFLLSPLPERFAARLGSMLDRFIDGLGGMRIRGRLVMCVLMTVANWLLIAANVSFALSAFGITVTYTDALFLLGVTALGVAIPTPGGAGSYHAAVILVLTLLWAVPADLARSYAIVMHLISFAPFIIGGIILLMSGQLRLLATMRQPQESKAAEATHA